MAYKITSECVKCGTCKENCPVGCIKEEEHQYVIDKDLCIGCGTCKEVCPIDVPEEDKD